MRAISESKSGAQSFSGFSFIFMAEEREEERRVVNKRRPPGGLLFFISVLSYSAFIRALTHPPAARKEFVERLLVALVYRALELSEPFPK
jgi:hypothetical protein